MHSPFTYCAEELHKHDYARLASVRFAPKEQQEALLALYAFNHEIARVKDITREEMTGLIRLQWWREAIEEIHGKGQVRNHPAVQALKRSPLPKKTLLALIDAREVELSETPFPTLISLQDYIHSTSVALEMLALPILGVTAKKAQKAYVPLATAWGLATLLHSVAFYAAHRKCFLPLDRLEAAGLNAEDVFAANTKPLIPIAQEIAALAEAALAEAKAAPPLPALHIKTPLTRQLLKRLAKRGHDLWHPRLRPSRLSVQWALLRG